MESRDVGLPIDGHIFIKICIPAGHIIFIVMFHSFYGYFYVFLCFWGSSSEFGAWEIFRHYLYLYTILGAAPTTRLFV